MEHSLLAGQCILLVEDEPLVRLDTEKRLEAAGASVLATSRLDHALKFADHPDLSAGVLDFDLGRTDSTAVCCRLTDRHIPFVLHSGSVHSAFRQWPAAPVVLKLQTQGLIAAVAALFR
jgi:CheY-like chemotaxis protein